jgi:hypothetical protein
VSASSATASKRTQAGKRTPSNDGPPQWLLGSRKHASPPGGRAREQRGNVRSAGHFGTFAAPPVRAPSTGLN